MRARYTDGVRCKMLNSANFLPVICCMKPLSLRSTATGKGSVVFRASRVLISLAGVAKS